MEKEKSKLVRIKAYIDGFADETGKKVDLCNLDNFFVESYLCSLFLAKKSGKYGFIDKTGKEVIPCNLDYDYVNHWFSDGLCRVRKSGKYGFIDETGKEVIPCNLDYDDVEDDGFRDGLCRVKKSGKYGFIDKTGKEVIPCNLDYDTVGKFSDGLCCVKKSWKYGFIDKTGKEVIPCNLDYTYVEDDGFRDGLCRVMKSGKYGIIDKTGKEVIPLVYEDIGKFGYFSDGLCPVKKGKWGFIDKTGEEVIPLVYEDIDEYSSSFFMNGGYAAIKKSGKWGLIDKTGIGVFPCQLINIEGKKTIGETKESLFQTDSVKCYFSLSSDKESILEELTLKNYGKQKEDVVPDGTISFKCADGSSLSFNYKGGLVTYLPVLKKWVSTAHIAVSDEDLTKILREGTTVTTQQGETLPVKEAYEDYLCLKFLVCPLACTDEQKAYLQNMVDKEKQEAERYKAAELEAKRQEEDRKAAEERAKAEAIATAERAAKEKEEEKKPSVFWLLCKIAIVIYMAYIVIHDLYYIMYGTLVDSDGNIIESMGFWHYVNIGCGLLILNSVVKDIKILMK